VPRLLAAALALALAALAALPAPPAAAATRLTKTLRDRRTHFSVKVPRGFKLTFRNGVYTIADRRAKLIYARAKTQQTAAQAGDAIARGEQATVSGRRASARAFRATLATPSKGRRVLEINRRGAYLTISTYADLRTRKASTAGGPLARAAITSQEIALLRRISATANGGQPIALGAGVRLKPFTARDGSATAFVPDLPGWSYDGLKGVVEGGNPTQGSFAFGVVFYAQTPATFVLLRSPAFVDAPGFVDAGTALTTLIPQWFTKCCQIPLANVQITGELPGSQQFLGLGYQSGFFTATFTVGGRPWQGVFLLGTNPTTGVDGDFFIYYSYVAVPVGTSPAIGEALLETWASWNPSADQQRRRNETLATILSTHFSGGPIDQAVFDKAAADWDAYFRE
jgi:hypothetical protein